MKPSTIIKWVVGVVVIVVIAGVSFGTVGAGQVGIETRFSKVVGEKQAGLYAVIPFVESVTVMDVQTQKEQTEAEAASSDLQTVKATVAVNYNIDPAQATFLYSNIGVDYKTKVIDPAIQEVVKAVTATYTAEELITKRPAVTDAIQTQLATRLQPDFIHVSTVSIVDFAFSDEFNAAIEAKVTAQQNALAAQNKLQQIQFEAQQTVATAKAQAEAIQIQVQAINSQGGADYVQLQAIKQWDGHYPSTYAGGSALPLIQISPKN